MDAPYTKILEVIVGSTVHGTAVEDGLEDLDLMAVVVESLDTFTRFDRVDVWVRRTQPEGVRSSAGDTDWVAYGLKKYLSLALKGNPSILLALFVPDAFTKEITFAGEGLRKLAPRIVSKQVYTTYRGYMRQQLKHLGHTGRTELLERYGFDTKAAAHIIRLSLQGQELLSTGKVSLPLADENRQLCVDIRSGKYDLAEFEQMFKSHSVALDEAYATSDLPEEPDLLFVQNWMRSVYQYHWIPRRQKPSYIIRAADS